MFRGLSWVAALAVIGCRQDAQETAEEVFRRFEESLLQAPSFSLECKGEITSDEPDGGLRRVWRSKIIVKCPGRFRHSFKEDLQRGRFRTATFGSDGSTSYVKDEKDGELEEENQYKRQGDPTPTVVQLVTRFSFAVLHFHLRDLLCAPGITGQEGVPKPWLPVWDLRLTRGEQVAGVSSLRIDYVTKHAEFEIQSSLWLDATGLVPLKRTATWREGLAAYKLTETYANLSKHVLPDIEFAR